MELVPEIKAEAPVSETDGLEALQSATERTRTLTVTERIVATSTEGVQAEVEKSVNVFIRPIPFRKWLDVLGHMTNVLAHLPTGEIDLADEAQLAIWIMNLVGKVPEDILAVASIAIEKNEDFFGRIDLDEGVKIILSVVEVNKDFFVQKVLPMFYEVAPKLKEAMAETFGPKA